LADAAAITFSDLVMNGLKPGEALKTFGAVAGAQFILHPESARDHVHDAAAVVFGAVLRHFLEELRSRGARSARIEEDLHDARVDRGEVMEARLRLGEFSADQPDDGRPVVAIERVWINLAEEIHRRGGVRQIEDFEEVALAHGAASERGDQCRVSLQFLGEGESKGGVPFGQFDRRGIVLQHHEERPLMAAERLDDAGDRLRQGKAELVEGPLALLRGCERCVVPPRSRVVEEVKDELIRGPAGFRGRSCRPGGTVGMNEAEFGRERLPPPTPAHHRARNGRPGDAHFHRAPCQAQGTMTEGDTELGGGCGRGHRAVIKTHRAWPCNATVTFSPIFDSSASLPLIFPIGF
jgi:hypothetical protein